MRCLQTLLASCGRRRSIGSGPELRQLGGYRPIVLEGTHREVQRERETSADTSALGDRILALIVIAALLFFGAGMVAVVLYYPL
ncbi:MAG: hypothetical protein HYY85_18415 [Deltaproteobacteria bacterium]|nr:hypothetical protein [Deltaproteobacteria bacterium]